MSVNDDYFKSREFKELLDNYEASIKAGNSPFMDADDLVDIADYYNQNNRMDEAIEVVEYSLQLYPHATLPNVFMARQALMQSDFMTACEYADNIENKDDPDYHYLRAEIMLAEGDVDKADRYLRDYAMTVEADEYSDFVKDCANLYVDYNVYEKAYEWMMRNPKDHSTDAKELMAFTLMGLGKNTEATKLFNELIDANPYSVKYWKALAGIQIAQQDYSSSITSSEYAIAINPKTLRHCSPRPAPSSNWRISKRRRSITSVSSKPMTTCKWRCTSFTKSWLSVIVHKKNWKKH